MMTYNTISQTKFKNSLLNLGLYDYSDAYILTKVTVSMAPVPPPGLKQSKSDTEVVFKHFVPFIDCISEINST